MEFLFTHMRIGEKHQLQEMKCGGLLPLSNSGGFLLENVSESKTFSINERQKGLFYLNASIV